MEKRENKSYRKKDAPMLKKRLIVDTDQNLIESDDIRLNKYIANAGICSRRDADLLIQNGGVTVNGKICTQLGVKVKKSDVIKVGDKVLRSEAPRYLLLNKPKDYVTTTDDPQNRKTVMELIKGACKERIYPVGRLDRNTTGLLLFTNDGDLAKKLMHPSHKIKKVYQATLDKNLKKEDLVKISQGVDLEDGHIEVDAIAYSSPDLKNVIGIEIHSGKYHIVKRIFEALDYKVIKLDRTLFGPLTKKDLPRGRWRMLSQEELNILKRI